MSITTNLSGRLRNTSLPASHGLMPLFEAVVNSIHSIEEAACKTSEGKIIIDVVRARQSSLNIPRMENSDKILGFKITDNGIGFNDVNLESFETLDTEHKVDNTSRTFLWDSYDDSDEQQRVESQKIKAEIEGYGRELLTAFQAYKSYGDKKFAKKVQ